MKAAWVRLNEWSKEMVTSALEAGADALIIPPGYNSKVKALGRIVTISPDGDLNPGSDVFFEPLNSAEDEIRIAELLKHAPVVLESYEIAHGSELERQRWEVIPVENLLAHGGRLFVPVHSIEETELALGVLERGVAGVVIHAKNIEDLRFLLNRVKKTQEFQVLQTAVIENLQPVGMGDRVCVDTCTLMSPGEGLLVGNSSGFLFLVQAEVMPNPYVAPRPFRVNAGPVHAYVRVPEERTRYLSELAAGDTILVVHASGRTQSATVGRSKIERRPLLLIEASCGDLRGTVLLQNAETIRLTSPDGEAVSVAQLRPGDSVLVAIEEPGRHFGRKITETILEH